MPVAIQSGFHHILIFKHFPKSIVGIGHELRLISHQVFFLETAFHQFQGFQVFSTGFHHAVVFVITYAVDVVGAGIQEYDDVVSCQG